MTQDMDCLRWHVMDRIADEKTTRSFKRTINAAILLRAARDPTPATPRKTSRVMAFLGLAGVLVGQHEGLLRILIHHSPF